MPDNPNLADINLVESQILKDNPHADIISELNALKPSLLKELQNLTKKHEILLEELTQLKKIQKQQNQANQAANKDSTEQDPSQVPNEPQKRTQIAGKIEQTPVSKKTKDVNKSANAISEKHKQLKNLQLRLELLNLGKSLGSISPARLQQLQRIFNHYCNYIFKSGRHVTFDRIEYEKSHLIMERFFAFIHDFQINKYIDQLRGEKQLVPKHQLILIFKKSSSNSRNLELTEFIACIERFAVLRYDFEESYEERQRKQEMQRKRIKQINLRREKQRERRKKQKQEYEERKKQEELKKVQQQEERKRKQLEASQNQGGQVQGQQPKEETKEQRKQRKKRQKQKKKKKKQTKGENQSEAPQLAKSEQSNPENNNDEMLNELMQKDSSIENPNEQFSHLKKYKKSSKTNLYSAQDAQSQELRVFQLLSLSKEQKVQLLYKAIELDQPKSVQAKLREYEKPLFKQLASDRKSSIMLNSSSMSKIKQTDHNHEIKLNQLKTQLQQKRKQQQKLNISRSITDQKYSIKKKEDYEKYLIKSIAINNNDIDALEQRKSQNKKKPQTVQLSLNMLNQSSDAELTSMKLGKDLRRYFQPEQDDTVYLKQYGGLQKIRSSNSSYIQRPPRYSVDIKKRANQLEEQEKKNEQQKLQRFALQMYKNQHYMKRFLERKF